MKWLNQTTLISSAKCARTRARQLKSSIVEIDEIAVIEAGVLLAEQFLRTRPSGRAFFQAMARGCKARSQKKYGDKVNLDHSGGLQVKIGNEFSGV